jgi:hypothetical protein
MLPEEGSGPGATLSSVIRAGPAYVYRIRFRAGQMSRPHYHDQDRWVSFLGPAGGGVTRTLTCFAGQDRPREARRLAFHLKGLHHYDGRRARTLSSKSWGWGQKTIPTEVDAQGKPVSADSDAKLEFTLRILNS